MGPKKVAVFQILGDLRVTWFENMWNFGRDLEVKFVCNDYTNPNTNPHNAYPDPKRPWRSVWKIFWRGWENLNAIEAWHANRSATRLLGWERLLSIIMAAASDVILRSPSIWKTLTFLGALVTSFLNWWDFHWFWTYLYALLGFYHRGGFIWGRGWTRKPPH